MCVGIAIVGVVPSDGGPISFYGKEGNSSHDALLSEFVPVELHNRSFKLEYIFPSTTRLDAPDEACQQQAVYLGIAEVLFGVARLKKAVEVQVTAWLRDNPIKHDLKTLQEANLQRAYLQRANLWGADLQGADLQEANLQGAVVTDDQRILARASGAILDTEKVA